MRLLDEQYIETPIYGIDKMTEWLRRQGHYVNHKRVRWPYGLPRFQRL
ncbi:MAG TPA: IS3 family transposase [Sedimentisphaerales bacterium]|nr:IS3 family transposase [Sedimentisphaerales bacterium]